MQRGRAARRDSPYWPRVARRIDHWDEIGRREPSGGSLPAKTWVERPKGIEPSPSVWKTEALPLSYGRALPWDGGQRTGWRSAVATVSRLGTDTCPAGGRTLHLGLAMGCGA